MKLKKKVIKKFKGKKSKSTWVNLTNPSHTTWDMDGKKKLDLQKRPKLNKKTLWTKMQVDPSELDQPILEITKLRANNLMQNKKIKTNS